MKKSIKIIMIFSVVFCFISWNQKPNYKLEEQKIRKVWDKMCVTGVVNYWEDYSSCLYQGPEIQFLHPEYGQWLSGWDEVKKVYEPLMNSGIKAEFLKNDLKLHFSKDADLAWGTVDAVIKHIDSDSQIFHTWNIVVFKKVNDDWKLILANQSAVKK